ncbi:hypothetical protein BYT27DRAFT_6844748 [Phlegmacium glaucopus]|nr:hypothetical protein BYT27DRAFT_6844748 [Phlegmacium glaucopus]
MTEEKSSVPESVRFLSEISMADYQRFRSTRIPDFVRRRFYLDDNLNIKASRIDMVVELKRSSSKLGKTKRGLVEAELQAKQQAVHALAEDERLMVVGYIAAVGNVWRYGEVDRRSEIAGGIHNADRDSTYTPGSSSGTPSTEASSPGWMTPPANRNQGFQRSPAPSPDSPRVLNRTPKVFTDPTSPAQKAWLTDIHERLNFLDTEMAPLYI